MFDLKVINSVLDQFEEERGIPKEKVLEAIETALATAYKKEHGKRGQIIRASFDPQTGDVAFEQVKIVVDPDSVIVDDETDLPDELPGEKSSEEDEKVRYNPEHHIYLSDARRIKKDAEIDDEIVFPLEEKGEYGRISAQTAKQVIIQKIREAEKVSVYSEFEHKQGEIITGNVQRIERGNIFVDLGRATGLMPYEEQIPGERFKQGERIRALLYSVEETPRGIFLRLSRSRPEFLEKLFEMEAPEVANGVVEIKGIAREAGSRSKIAVASNDEYVDPVGSLVGQRGVRVSTVMSELGNEKIDIIEHSTNPNHFVEEALSPARVLSVEIDEEEDIAKVLVAPDQQSLAIGKGGQNARLAARLTGLKIDIQAAEGAENSDDNDLDEPTRDEASSDNESGEVEEEEGREDEDMKESSEEAEDNSGEDDDPITTKESDESDSTSKEEKVEN